MNVLFAQKMCGLLGIQAPEDLQEAQCAIQNEILAREYPQSVILIMEVQALKEMPVACDRISVKPSIMQDDEFITTPSYGELFKFSVPKERESEKVSSKEINFAPKTRLRCRSHRLPRSDPLSKNLMFSTMDGK